MYFLTLLFSLISEPIKIQYRDLAIDKEKYIVPFKRAKKLLRSIVSITLY